MYAARVWSYVLNPPFAAKGDIYFVCEWKGYDDSFVAVQFEDVLFSLIY